MVEVYCEPVGIDEAIIEKTFKNGSKHLCWFRLHTMDSCHCVTLLESLLFCVRMSLQEVTPASMGSATTASLKTLHVPAVV